MAPTPQDGTTVILTSPRPAVWVYVLGAANLVAVGWFWVATLTGPSPFVIFPFGTAALCALLLIVSVRPPRIELHPAGLVVIPLVRTHRVPYADVIAVHGDSGRVEWSTRLHLELVGGRRIPLPRVDRPLTETQDLIARRAGLGGTPGADLPSAPSPPARLRSPSAGPGRGRP